MATYSTEAKSAFHNVPSLPSLSRGRESGLRENLGWQRNDNICVAIVQKTACWQSEFFEPGETGRNNWRSVPHIVVEN
jgi:hypothetical protein